MSNKESLVIEVGKNSEMPPYIASMISNGKLDNHGAHSIDDDEFVNVCKEALKEEADDLRDIISELSF